MSSNGRGAEIESSLPGRIRLRLPRQARREDVLSNITGLLCGLEGIVDVTTNAATGSMLVTSDPDVLDIRKVQETLRDADLLISAGQEIEAIAEEEHWPGFSHIAHSALCKFKRYDRAIKRRTGGKIDGKMLIVLFILLLGISRAIAVGRKTPAPWHALIWYAYSMFMQWHDPHKIMNSPNSHYS